MVPGANGRPLASPAIHEAGPRRPDSLALIPVPSALLLRAVRDVTHKAGSWMVRLGI